MANRKKLTREERLEKKRIAEKIRYQRIKNDREKYQQQKDKEKKKYQKKKEKGIIKTVDKMTPREKRKVRKLWREKAKKRRDRLALQRISNAPETPSGSDNEAPILPRPQNDGRAQVGPQKRLAQARRARKALLKQKIDEIEKLKATVERYRKRLNRVARKCKKPTPNTKVNALIDSPTSRDTIKKKLLFGEVISEQLKENFAALSTEKEKRIFKRVISGKLVTKYKVLEKEKTMKPLTKLKQKLSLSDPKRRARKQCYMLKKRIEQFMEDDINSRVCAGKKDFINKQGDRKQKRVMLDTLQNLHKLFMKKSGVTISYSVFCKLRPYWIVPPRCDQRNTCMCITHANMDLIIKSLHRAKTICESNHVGLLNSICCNRYHEKCLSRDCQGCKNKSLIYKEFDNSVPLSYEKWQSVRQDFVDPKTKKMRTITKCVKSTLEIYPRDFILELEEKLEQFLRHELNIVHQYIAIKTKKEVLTEKDAIVHIDFSENYQTKYAEEIQSFHFGGSRQQISMHTVVVYTKEEGGEEIKTECFCSLSENLSHSPPAIWAHLQPILDSLPTRVTNLHFLSDGPVTQYRNKSMFQVLASQLQAFYPNLVNYTWNYHEAGHGKGAPDGVGATCKRTADRLVASGNNISSLEELTNALQKNCPNIKILTISNEEILAKEAQINPAANTKTFTGTLKVHQVTGSVFLPNRLVMKNLSCFCDPEFCSHYVMGSVDYPVINPKPRLDVEEVFGPKSDSDDDEPLMSLMTEKQIVKTQESPQASGANFNKTQSDDGQLPSTSGKKSVKNGDFVVVKLLHRQTEYRYVAMCTGVEEEGEIQVVFCKICDDTGRNFKVNHKDISFVQWDQIIENLPTPNLKMKGQRMFYTFKESITVFEQA